MSKLGLYEILGEDKIPNNFVGGLTVLPMLLDSSGKYSEAFLSFVQNISDAILYQNWNSLYELSDKSVTYQEFIAMIEKSWGPHIKTFNAVSSIRKGLAIDLNVDRFKMMHRKSLASFYITDYMLMDCSDEVDTIDLSMSKYAAELWFTCKHHRLVVLPVFTPYVMIKE